jgi:outer membrane biosynthesis protein TonB
MVAEVHAEQVKSARRQQVIAGVMVLCLAVLIGVGWQKSQTRATEIDLTDALPSPVAANAIAPADLVVQDVIDESTTEKKQNKGTKKASSEKTPAKNSGSSNKTSSRSVGVSALGEEVGGPDIGLLSVNSNTDLMGGLDLTVNRKEEKGITLTTDDQIKSMVGRVLDRQTPRLRSCYERRLKAVEGLQGVWVIGMTVNKDGSVSGVSVTAQEDADDELERCIQSRVLDWSFQPISKALPVNKIVSFTPR